MFGIEDIIRIRMQEATQEGLNSQFAQRNRDEKQKPVSRRFLLVTLLAALAILIAAGIAVSLSATSPITQTSLGDSASKSPVLAPVPVPAAPIEFSQTNQVSLPLKTNDKKPRFMPAPTPIAPAP